MKYYTIVEYKMIISDLEEIIDFNYGDLCDGDFDETIFETGSEEEAFERLEEEGSDYEFIDDELYITERELRVTEADAEGFVLSVGCYLAEPCCDDLDEAKEYAESICCVSGQIDVNDLLKAFVRKFGNDERGSYDIEHNLWFSSNAVVEFIKEFAERNC